MMTRDDLLFWMSLVWFVGVCGALCLCVGAHALAAARPAIEGGTSRNQAAKQFGVAISTAIGWMKRVEETGSVEPSQIGGYKPKAVSGDHAVWLSQRIRDGDFTIRGLVAELAGRGLKVDYHSVWDFVHAEKLSFKKKRGGWRTRSTRGREATSPVDKISRSRRS